MTRLGRGELVGPRPLCIGTYPVQLRGEGVVGVCFGGRLRVPGRGVADLRRLGLEVGDLGAVMLLGLGEFVGQRRQGELVGQLRKLGFGAHAFPLLRVTVVVGIGRRYPLRPARGHCLCRRRRRWSSITIEPCDDAIHVIVEVGIGPNGDTVAVDKGPNRLRDVFFRRHRRTANEERHDRNLPGQRGLDLDPHKVSGIVEPRRVALRIQPAGTDDGQQDIALAHHPTEIFAEIDTQRDRIQILQNLLVTIVHHEPVEDPARDISGVLTSVTDEYLGHQLAGRIIQARDHGCSPAFHHGLARVPRRAPES